MPYTTIASTTSPATTPDAAGGDSANLAGRASRWRSLRAKGVYAFLLFVAYMATIATIMGNERHQLVRLSDQMSATREAEIEIVEAASAIDEMEARLQHGIHYGEPMRGVQETFAGDLDRLRRRISDLLDEYPDIGNEFAAIESRFASLPADPDSDLMFHFMEPIEQLESRLIRHGREHRQEWFQLRASYEAQNRRMNRLLVTLVGLGAVMIGGLIMWFVTRLVADLRHAQSRAAEVAAGYMGPPLPVRRQDELGGLLRAINRMQRQMFERETKLELARQQRYHHEKMAAVGWLAAAVAHEVNNPIAAIAGIGERIRGGASAPGSRTQEELDQAGRMILEQTARVSSILRQLSEFTQPTVAEPALIDLNALVKATCAFVAYDRRLAGVSWDYDLDPSLPAVQAIADHVTQVLMNLLLNAADALQETSVSRRRIRIGTRLHGDAVTLSVGDTGIGMTPDVVARAFDEMFSTKADGRGRGLGLFTSRELIRQAGGRMELSSERGKGTTVTVTLPVRSPSEPGAAG